MLELTCTNCKGTLQIDDAFAGGVCRCMYCGTIQTVPSHLKRRPAAAKKSQGLSPPVRRAQTLHTGTPRPPATGSPPAGSGSAQWADAVTGSGGLSGSGLPSPADPAHPSASTGERDAEPAAPSPGLINRDRLILAGSAAATLLIVLLVAAFLLSGGDPSSPPQGASPSSTGSGSAMASTANFCGEPLGGRSIVYVLSRGSANDEVFGDVKEACYRSIASLGPHRTFQIILLDGDAGGSAFPRTGPAPADGANVASARAALDRPAPPDASSRTVARPGGTTLAAVSALPDAPEAVVLACADGHEPHEAVVRQLDQLRTERGTKIYTFALGSADPGVTTLQTLARRTGGTFHAIPPTKLREYAD